MGNKPIMWKPLAGLPHIKTVMGIAAGSVSDFDFGRCDGHHEMVDLRLTNPLAVEPDGSFARRTRRDVKTHPVKPRRDP